jgi:alkanesulfonate monooxygenase SsuD/methylene tetrahydromethanopterin reductase-like flavin-dependent oxidoreductase (luciferase family)
VNAGISIIPYADELPRIRELAQAADAGGLQLVAIQDHPYKAVPMLSGSGQ